MKPVVLAILDGYGIAPATAGNAIALTPTPALSGLVANYPAVTLKASGEAVGLPYGEMGNSEVGHLTIGIGRVYDQNFLRITKSIWNKSFFQNTALADAIQHANERGSTLHFIGLTSAGGVHAYIEHLYALLELAVDHRVRSISVHAILDGRDSAFNSGINFIARLEERLKLFGVGRIASVCGRAWAMDKDNRWDRVSRAYAAMVDGTSEEFYTDASRAIQNSYNRGVYDEQFVPVALRDPQTRLPVSRIRDGDAVVFFNFRSDRVRELLTAFCLPGFSKFSRPLLRDLALVTMTTYDPRLPVAVAFSPELITTSLAKVISDAGLSQLHIAETEKYAHVTYFFNGMREEAYPAEVRILVPSPRVNSYSEEPDMSTEELTRRAVSQLLSSRYHFIVVNYANVDMVAHTGDFEATQRAVSAVDRAMGELAEASRKVGATLLVTADHGNAEDMVDPHTGLRTTTHSANPVPLILVNPSWYGRVRQPDLAVTAPVAGLSALASTVLDLLGLPTPPEMEAAHLLEELRLPLPRNLYAS